MRAQIKAELSVDALLSLYPEAAETFNRHGMICVGCYLSRFHTLADAAAAYRLDLNTFITEICAALDAKLNDRFRGSADGSMER